MTASISQVSQTAEETTLPLWKPATWEDYLAYRDHSMTERVKLFFNEGYLFIEMGAEGINHATIGDLFAMLFILWFSQKPEQVFSSFGRCLLEKPQKKASAPDIVLYLGENYPRWQPGEPRFINLNQWRVPNLVGEISDTTLATDLDEKKQLYAELEMPEYWVVDVKGLRVFAFQLQENGKYLECDYSLALEGIPISLLNKTLEQLSEASNGSAASWFAQEIAHLNAD